jgi:hypothetical protein
MNGKQRRAILINAGLRLTVYLFDVAKAGEMKKITEDIGDRICPPTARNFSTIKDAIGF